MAKKKLTEDEKIRRRAARKANAVNAKLRDDTGPLFEHEIPQEDFTNATDEYWSARQQWASGNKGTGAEDLLIVASRLDLFLVRCIARKHMSAADFATADENAHKYGPILDFWKNVITGRKKLTIGWNVTRHGHRPCFSPQAAPVCCEHGCRYCESRILLYIEQTTMTPTLHWPAPDWQSPLTPEQFDALTTTPEPMDNEHGQELDAQVSALLAKVLK